MVHPIIKKPVCAKRGGVLYFRLYMLYVMLFIVFVTIEVFCFKKHNIFYSNYFYSYKIQSQCLKNTSKHNKKEKNIFWILNSEFNLKIIFVNCSAVTKKLFFNWIFFSFYIFNQCYTIWILTVSISYWICLISRLGMKCMFIENKSYGLSQNIFLPLC